MNKQELYTNFISKVEEYLKLEDFENLDFILQSVYSMGFDDNTISLIDDILQEATLFLEFKEEDYKNEASKLIEEFKK
ncbi:hypothetical protein DLH72_02895 [Candidatus Gracilibacteria bacterium]|nr:MAG: hypothetical protein DLH72_02895 [Candidatus Gracilibacteria bacterium]